MGTLNVISRSTESAAPFLVASDVVRILLSAEETGGLMTLAETIVPPGGGPPMHTHEREDETFHVLEGEVTVIVNGRTVRAGPGTTAFLPRGSVHRFTNQTNRSARMLVTVTPGGIDGMFREIAQPLPAGFDANKPPAPPSPERIAQLVAACGRYGVRFT